MGVYLIFFFPQYEMKMFLVYHFLWKCVHWLAKQVRQQQSHVVILIRGKWMFKEQEKKLQS